MMKTLAFAVHMVAPTDESVASRELTVSGVHADGKTPLPATVVPVGMTDRRVSVEVPEGASVKLDLADLDEARGVRGTHALHFLATDEPRDRVDGQLSVTPIPSPTSPAPDAPPAAS